MPDGGSSGGAEVAIDRGMQDGGSAGGGTDDTRDREMLDGGDAGGGGRTTPLGSLEEVLCWCKSVNPGNETTD